MRSNYRPCLRCGKTFQRWDTYATRGAHCSYCHRCYLAYTRERSYRNGKAKGPRPAPAPIVPGRRYDGRTESKLLRARVLIEETHCGICGELVDKTLSGRERRGPSIDHIVPLALGGGQFERSNVRLTHLGCNSSNNQRQTKELLKWALAEIDRLRALLGIESESVTNAHAFILSQQTLTTPKLATRSSSSVSALD